MILNPSTPEPSDRTKTADGQAAWRRSASGLPDRRASAGVPGERRAPGTPARSRRKRIALSLSGGGLTGAYYEIGCLAALDDFLGFDFSSSGFDIYIGVSAGATVAGLLAKGIPIRKIYWALLTNSDDTLNFRRADMYDVNRWAILFSAIKIGLSVPGYFVSCLQTRLRPSPFEFMHYIEERLPAGLFALDNYQRFFAKVLEAHGK